MSDVMDMLTAFSKRQMPMPGNVMQATWMQGVGLLWLKQNAPDRLTPEGKALADEFRIVVEAVAGRTRSPS